MKPSTMKPSIFFNSLIILFVVSNSLSGQFQAFADSYGLLSTVAGKGEIDNGSIGWLPAYENGNAIDAELTRPHFAMADAEGNIYIADKDAHGIRKVTTDGKIHTIAGTNVAGDNGDGLGHECQLNSPNGLWVKENGTVYILDLGNDKVRRLNTDSSLVTVFEDPDGISLGRGIWVTSSEDSIFYACGSKVRLWTEEDGARTYASGFSGLGNITMDKNGFLVVTDRSQNLVYRISKDGLSNTIIAGDGSRLSKGNEGYQATDNALFGVRGVWFLDDNSYFVATHEGSQIWYIDTAGWMHLFLNGADGDEFHSGDGEDYRTPGYKISEPRSVSVDFDGNVIITENDNGFIRKIENDYTYYYTSMINYLIEDQGISVYPNPARSEALVKYFRCEPGKLSLTLSTIHGAVVETVFDGFQSDGFHSLTIDTSTLPEGLYFISITENSHIRTEKLLIRN
jgi:hypothetical protein